MYLFPFHFALRFVLHPIKRKAVGNIQPAHPRISGRRAGVRVGGRGGVRAVGGQPRTVESESPAEPPTHSRHVTHRGQTGPKTTPALTAGNTRTRLRGMDGLRRGKENKRDKRDKTKYSCQWERKLIVSQYGHEILRVTEKTP